MLSFRPNHSRKILFRLALMSAAAAVAVVLAFDFITGVYLKDQLNPSGLALNGSILVLFLASMGRIVFLLLHYAGEEKTLRRFILAMEEGGCHPVADVEPRSLIFARFRQVLALNKENAAVNHGALAAQLVAAESTRVSFPKFVNGVLVLMGVFGTIVGLAIALVGASGMLSASQDVGTMGVIISGMSTALSTTITAVVCYLFHGYFFQKLTDAQTNVISTIEQITTLYLIPRYGRTVDGMLSRVAGLVDGLTRMVDEMRETQADFRAVSADLKTSAAHLAAQIAPLGKDMASIKEILREGFRLREVE